MVAVTIFGSIYKWVVFFSFHRALLAHGENMTFYFGLGNRPLCGGSTWLFFVLFVWPCNALKSPSKRGLLKLSFPVLSKPSQMLSVHPLSCLFHPTRCCRRHFRCGKVRQVRRFRPYRWSWLVLASIVKWSINA